MSPIHLADDAGPGERAAAAMYILETLVHALDQLSPEQRRQLATLCARIVAAIGAASGRR